MRCILLGTVCPKLVAQGNTTLALQLANMASYSLLNKMNRVDVAFYLSDDIAKYGAHLAMNLYRYLLKVAPDYFLRTNVFKDGYLNRDPFRVEHARWNHGGDAKLFFARRMNRLEQDIATTADPNQKAMLMIDFGIGLRNSFDYCWALTQYVRGWVSGGYLSDWEYSEQTRQAQTRADQLIVQAFKTFTDDEYQA